MQIHISPGNAVPIYLQVFNQVKYLVSSGRCVAGEELPPIRTLAEKLLINPNTVARAYRELELAGFVVKHGTAGTYVSASPPKLSRRDRVRILSQRVDSLIAEARQLDISVGDVVELIYKAEGAVPAESAEN